MTSLAVTLICRLRGDDGAILNAKLGLRRERRTINAHDVASGCEWLSSVQHSPVRRWKLPVSKEDRHRSILSRSADPGNIPNRAIRSGTRVGAPFDLDAGEPKIGMQAVSIDEDVQHKRVCARSRFRMNPQSWIAANAGERNRDDNEPFDHFGASSP